MCACVVSVDACTCIAFGDVSTDGYGSSDAFHLPRGRGGAERGDGNLAEQEERAINECCEYKSVLQVQRASR